ncbi:hypothetical protein AAMO2058_001686200 [Amorphochlora amoebiformis]
MRISSRKFRRLLVENSSSFSTQRQRPVNMLKKMVRGRWDAQIATRVTETGARELVEKDHKVKLLSSTGFLADGLKIYWESFDKGLPLSHTTSEHLLYLLTTAKLSKNPDTCPGLDPVSEAEKIFKVLQEIGDQRAKISSHSTIARVYANNGRINRVEKLLRDVKDEKGTYRRKFPKKHVSGKLDVVEKISLKLIKEIIRYYLSEEKKDVKGITDMMNTNQTLLTEFSEQKFLRSFLASNPRQLSFSEKMWVFNRLREHSFNIDIDSAHRVVEAWCPSQTIPSSSHLDRPEGPPSAISPSAISAIKCAETARSWARDFGISEDLELEELKLEMRKKLAPAAIYRTGAYFYPTHEVEPNPRGDGSCSWPLRESKLSEDLVKKVRERIIGRLNSNEREILREMEELIIDKQITTVVDGPNVAMWRRNAHIEAQNAFAQKAFDHDPHRFPIIPLLLSSSGTEYEPHRYNFNNVEKVRKLLLDMGERPLVILKGGGRSHGNLTRDWNGASHALFVSSEFNDDLLWLYASLMPRPTNVPTAYSWIHGDRIRVVTNDCMRDHRHLVNDIGDFDDYSQLFSFQDLSRWQSMQFRYHIAEGRIHLWVPPPHVRVPQAFHLDGGCMEWHLPISLHDTVTAGQREYETLSDKYGDHWLRLIVEPDF